MVVEIGRPATLQNTLIAAHSYDADWRPLSTYYFQEIRFLHIQGPTGRFAEKRFFQACKAAPLSNCGQGSFRACLKKYRF